MYPRDTYINSEQLLLNYEKKTLKIQIILAEALNLLIHQAVVMMAEIQTQIILEKAVVIQLIQYPVLVKEKILVMNRLPHLVMMEMLI